MIKALFTAATGMKGQQTNVDVISNNIANVNTNGFKRSRVNFEDLLYLRLGTAGDAANGVAPPTAFEVGSGVRAVSTTRTFTPGSLEGTQRELDVAISGDGFFQVQLPDGTIAYTRDGAFHTDSQLNLVTAEGYLVDPSITIPADTQNISISPEGVVAVVTAGDTSTIQVVGQLQLTRFANPAGLSAHGSNLFLETPSSGAPTQSTPGQNGAGTLVQGYLERSNVDVVTELVNLIVAQRAYEVNSRAIRTGDEMLSQVNGLIR
ncbi:MAG: flagellar basal-body rod protein FlgG [Planctomycetota bacterium JB042]